MPLGSTSHHTSLHTTKAPATRHAHRWKLGNKLDRYISSPSHAYHTTKGEGGSLQPPSHERVVFAGKKTQNIMWHSAPVLPPPASYSSSSRYNTFATLQQYGELTELPVRQISSPSSPVKHTPQCLELGYSPPSPTTTPSSSSGAYCYVPSSTAATPSAQNQALLLLQYQECSRLTGDLSESSNLAQ